MFEVPAASSWGLWSLTAVMASDLDALVAAAWTRVKLHGGLIQGNPNRSPMTICPESVARFNSLDILGSPMT
jgi:hypothetical protein